MTTYVAYTRVSTDAQGRSGLGLEAQKAAIIKFVGKDDRVIETFTEVESGKINARPELHKAIAMCRVRKATLLIAKLDRLSRDVAFIANLMKSDVKFIACDMPHADSFRLHIEAAVAEEERNRISMRTRQALAAAKARGVRLGGARDGAGFRQGSDHLQHAIRASAKVRNKEAARHAALTCAIIREIKKEHPNATLRLIADKLNDQGWTTSMGGRWHSMTVKRVLEFTDLEDATMPPDDRIQEETPETDH